MSPDTIARIEAIKAPHADAKFVASLCVMFEDWLDEIGLPLTADQRFALAALAGKAGAA